MPCSAIWYLYITAAFLVFLNEIHSSLLSVDWHGYYSTSALGRLFTPAPSGKLLCRFFEMLITVLVTLQHAQISTKASK